MGATDDTYIHWISARPCAIHLEPGNSQTIQASTRRNVCTISHGGFERCKSSHMGSSEYSQRHATHVLAWHKLDRVRDTSYDAGQYSAPDHCVPEDPLLIKRVLSRDGGTELGRLEQLDREVKSVSV